MLRPKVSTAPPVGDAASSFLLPYDETLAPTLHDALDAAAPGTTQRFRSCTFRRAKDAPLEKGTCTNPPPHAFVMHTGDFALLRPPENSMRPAVARVHAFLRQPTGSGAIRVQWFYRAEDLSERPRTATGEDELFETMHYDDVQLVALVGRATVGAYDEWEKRAFAARGGKPIDPEALEGAYPGDDRPAKTEGDDADSVASDASSFFWDNYSASAIEYYCRSMYDPNAHLFVPSRFEDPSADPEEELAALRESAVQDARDGDFAAGLGPVDASDDEYAGDAEEDGLREEVADLKGKRKRGRGRPRGSAQPRSGERGTERATQFALPADIGEAETLPCRDGEKARVRGFLEAAIEGSAKGLDAGARCLYVSGVPGTGKTATIREVLRTLRTRMSAGDLPPFDVVEVNGMSLPDANFVYTELLATMTGNTRVSPAQAAQLLEKRFASGGRKGAGRASVSARERGKCVVLLLDEMDVLVSRTQKVLYDVLDWPTRPGSNLVVIGVANTMDLPERMLPRLASRLGLNRLSYAPYTRVQLIEILGMRLGPLHPGVAFDESTVKLCAAKVGAVSGDVRRALELCRRAVEIAREQKEAAGGDGDLVVKPGHLTAAVADMSGASRLGALAELSLFETLAIIAAIALVRAHGSFAMEETSSVQAVCEKAAELARDNRELFEFGFPRAEEIEECIMRLSNIRILLLERSSMLRNSRVIINLLVDDCCFALREDKLAQKVLGM